jgi:hypothetical protein
MHITTSRKIYSNTAEEQLESLFVGFSLPISSGDARIRPQSEPVE